jgi:hypothetical protein
MDWAQFATMWKQLKEKIGSLRVRIGDDKKIAETLKSAQRSDDQARPFALTTAKNGMSSRNTSVAR